MQGEVVVIIGGSSGIGLAAARAFLEQGANVWLTARDEEKLAAAAASLPGSVSYFPADISHQSSVDELVHQINSRDGKIDVLLNSAGQLDLGSCEESTDIAERLMRVNYLGPARVIATALPLIRKGSRRSIVNLSSFVGRFTPPYWSAYAASKHALQSYSHALRQELRVERIHVGIVMPGPVLSPMTEDLLRTPMYHLPFGIPVITPDRVAQAILGCVLSGSPKSQFPPASAECYVLQLPTPAWSISFIDSPNTSADIIVAYIR